MAGYVSLIFNSALRIVTATSGPREYEAKIGDVLTNRSKGGVGVGTKLKFVDVIHDNGIVEGIKVISLGLDGAIHGSKNRIITPTTFRQNYMRMRMVEPKAVQYDALVSSAMSRHREVIDRLDRIESDVKRLLEIWKSNA